MMLSVSLSHSNPPHSTHCVWLIYSFSKFSSGIKNHNGEQDRKFPLGLERLNNQECLLITVQSVGQRTSIRCYGHP